VGAAESILAVGGAAEIQACAANLLRSEHGAVLAAVGPGLPDRDEVGDPRLLLTEEPDAEVSESTESTESSESTASSTPADDPTTAKPMPRADLRAAWVTHPPIRLVLPNGLTVLVSANPDSDVFAVHLVARGRTYCEPEGKAGMADLLHRLLAHGAGEWSRDELARQIDRSGIQLKLTDNPAFPYDDYQTTQEYSFVRLETVDRFFGEAFALLGAMVFEPTISDESLEEVRREALLLAERQAGMAPSEARRLQRQEIYADSRGARPALGISDDLATITVEDLRAFHDSYFAPSNLVVAIVTGLDPELIIDAVRERLGGAGENAGASPCAGDDEMLPVPTLAPVRREVEIGQEQSWVRIASVFECDPADVPALRVAALLLSDRVAFELRERQGLAYSVGASLGSRGNRAWVFASMGTRGENLDRGEAGLVSGVRELGESEISDEEVTKVVKSHMGRRRMRQITRINQAQELCLDAIAGKEIGAGSVALEELTSVTAEDVRRVAREYFTPASFVTVIAR
jgi:zinc protease